MPEAASTLKWIATVPITAGGQAFCWDPQQPDTLYTLLKRTHEVILARICRPAS